MGRAKDLAQDKLNLKRLTVYFYPSKELPMEMSRCSVTIF